MNAPTDFSDRDPLKLTVPALLLLRGFGAFDEYWKVELIDGELWGVPADGDDEPESDASYPIGLTIEQYALLAKSGAFVDYRKTELIDGKVYSVSPQYRPHGYVKDRLFSRLDRAVEALNLPFVVASEQSMSIPAMHQPQPDIMLTSDPSGDGAIPVSSVTLIVEVSDSSSRYDYRQKVTIYGAAGVPEYWIVDIVARKVRQLWQPVDGIYEQRRDVMFGDPLVAATITGLTIETDGFCS